MASYRPDTAQEYSKNPCDPSQSSQSDEEAMESGRLTKVLGIVSELAGVRSARRR